jgi:hypothetical protein
LTPSRLPAVSRPLRELPPAFLWAMGVSFRLDAALPQASAMS